MPSGQRTGVGDERTAGWRPRWRVSLRAGAVSAGRSRLPTSNPYPPPARASQIAVWESVREKPTSRPQSQGWKSPNLWRGRLVANWVVSGCHRDTPLPASYSPSPDGGMHERRRYRRSAVCTTALGSKSLLKPASDRHRSPNQHSNATSMAARDAVNEILLSWLEEKIVSEAKAANATSPA